MKDPVMAILPSTLNFFSNYRYSLVYGGGCIVGLVLNRYVLKKLSSSKKHGPPELRAMTNLNKTCRACIYLKRICARGEKECSYAILRWIIDLLGSARETIDAAIYLITCSEFRDAFVEAHKRGIRIRFISDATMSCGTGSAIPHLRAAGVEVRTAEPDERHMMHRKSVVIDNRCVLSGTGNWTMQSLCGNWDAFVKTDDPRAVEAFARAFEVEWELLGTPTLAMPTPATPTSVAPALVTPTLATPTPTPVTTILVTPTVVTPTLATPTSATPTPRRPSGPPDVGRRLENNIADSL